MSKVYEFKVELRKREGREKDYERESVFFHEGWRNSQDLKGRGKFQNHVSPVPKAIMFSHPIYSLKFRSGL